MNQLAIKSAVLAALGIITAPAMATGLVSIPTTGFTVSASTAQPSGGISAYTLCNRTGNYGPWYGSNNSTPPSSTANNTCAVFPANTLTAPENGFTLGLYNVRDMVVNNSYTSGSSITIGSVIDYIWRNSTTSMCIFGTRFSMRNTDWNKTVAGMQTFEINDFARNGLPNSTVTAGYYLTSNSDEVLFRIGRTFTSVQHRVGIDLDLDPTDVAEGYYDQPLSYLGASTAAINGVEAVVDYPPDVPTTLQQSALINTEWIDFSTDVNYLDDDGASMKDSSLLYVKMPCSAVPTTPTGSYRFRQTGQMEEPWVEIIMPGFKP
ncbi:hypothetical protein [Methylovorus glucosotrophus]|uniref:Uncharacterized protein n=1 Tax=Methylovorus glucosotrophus (strain SIP3-4) TaxID=582744 RepID=C6XC23_METGS|nr:hypothetical protein [Methylovorus glucosotrophus]ACT50098.1 conserved hypothetical protein [Methylovorus glucosotrophus SIP3-4]